VCLLVCDYYCGARPNMGQTLKTHDCPRATLPSRSAVL
jgi:hypothetical protein